MMPRPDGGSTNPPSGGDSAPYAQQGFSGVQSHGNRQQPHQSQPGQQGQQQPQYYPDDSGLYHQQHHQQQQRYMGPGGQAMSVPQGQPPRQAQMDHGMPQGMYRDGAAGMPMAMAQGGGFGSEVSPQVARMTTGGQNGGMFPAGQSFYGTGGMANSPNFPPSGMDDPMGPGAAMGHNGVQGAPNQDREDELLLQLLLARRQRGRISGDNFAEELMKLRQSRSAQARGSMPGMPPFYDAPPNMAAPHDSERIDRSPRLLDARSQTDFGRKRPHQAYTDMNGNIKYHMPMDQGVEVPPPSKKKRSHKKKPADMPRRPLSAYNLFFSEERERILKEIDEKEGGNKGENEGGADKKEGETTTKKEGEEEDSAKKEGEDDDDAKPKALLRPLIPSQKKRRPHRKTHGKVSFQQLAKMVGERWKSLDEDRRKYYQDLAQEDMKRQKIAMEAYYSKQNPHQRKSEADTTQESTLAES